MDDGVEVGVGPGLLVHPERDGGVVAVVADIAFRAVVVFGAGEIVGHEGGIYLLADADARGRVQVQRGLQLHRVDLVEHAFRIGDQVAVPGVAGPADALVEFVAAQAARGALPGIMPVHVDDHHVDGQLAAAEFPGQADEFIVGVGPEAAPPVAEHEFGRERHFAGHFREIGQCGLVIVSVGEQVKILHAFFRSGRYPFAPVAVVFDEDVAGAFIHHGPAVTREDAGLHRVAVVDVFRTGAAVEGAGRAEQVAGGVEAGMPGDGLAVHLERGFQVVGRESVVAPVGQGHGRGLDRQAVPPLLDGEAGNRQVPVDDGQGGAVLELAGRRPFHPDEAVGQDGEAGIARDDLRLRRRDGVERLGDGQTGRQQQGGQEGEETIHGLRDDRVSFLQI